MEGWERAVQAAETQAFFAEIVLRGLILRMRERIAQVRNLMRSNRLLAEQQQEGKHIAEDESTQHGCDFSMANVKKRNGQDYKVLGRALEQACEWSGRFQ